MALQQGLHHAVGEVGLALQGVALHRGEPDRPGGRDPGVAATLFDHDLAAGREVPGRDPAAHDLGDQELLPALTARPRPGDRHGQPGSHHVQVTAEARGRDHEAPLVGVLDPGGEPDEVPPEGVRHLQLHPDPVVEAGPLSGGAAQLRPRSSTSGHGLCRSPVLVSSGGVGG